ncbi:MAG TPA: aldo/keto reductase [Caldilineae bacterium]|nr:aldo/keto reductase [Caldilineae bacterium]
MEYRFLGKTGLKVSELCLGSMTFGREADEETSWRILDRFVEAGGNFIDTADVYSQGVSEEIVGRWMKDKRREDLIIATKVRFPMGDGPNDVGLSRKHILAAVEASLRRLNTDYIDLYQVHAWDDATPLEETLSTLDDLVRSGKVRYIGASNFSGWQLQKAIDISKQMGWEPFRCLQPLYNLLDRSTEWELIPVCINEGVGVIPWSPLRGGWLTGKYRRGMEKPPEGTRVDLAERQGWSESWSRYNNERTWRVIDELLAVAEEIGKTPAQVAINWLLRQPGVTAPIIGVRNLEQLEDNLGASGWALSEEHVKRLSEVSAVELPYPYDVLERVRRQ